MLLVEVRYQKCAGKRSLVPWWRIDMHDTHLHCDSARSRPNQSSNGTSPALRATAGRFFRLGSAFLFQTGNRVLDEVDALFQCDRRIPAWVADVAAESDVRQKSFVSVYLVDSSEKDLDTMHSVLLPDLHRSAQNTRIWRHICLCEIELCHFNCQLIGYSRCFQLFRL